MSDAAVLPGGRRVPAELVVEDGASSNSDLLIGTLIFAGSPPPVGTPITTTTGSTLYGPAVIRAAGTATQNAAICIGILIAVDRVDLPNTRARAFVQLRGTVALTADEWDAVAGTSGGLVASEGYWLDAPGHLASSPPGTSGDFVSMAGVALSATQLLLATPSSPIENP